MLDADSNSRQYLHTERRALLPETYRQLKANMSPKKNVGRAAVVNPPIRFETVRAEQDLDQLMYEEMPATCQTVTQFLPDRAQSLICENDSPDIPFRYSINPYRGCEHGCAYCYARPGHEFLGMNAGLDFESKILVKFNAPMLLRKELNSPSWRPEVLAISGVTDCYQPAERKFHITRGLLEVLAESRQPIGIVTKNALVLRDLDLLVPMAERNLVQANLSITTLDADLAQKMEPRTSTPSARLRAICELSTRGIPVRVMVAPVIPGLTDQEIPAILQAAQQAGARSAGYQLLRLPLSVAPVFTSWLAANFPLAKNRVESLIRDTRRGQLNDAEFGRRHLGEGPYARSIHRSFRVFAKKLGLNDPMPTQDNSQFRPPRSSTGQMRLF